MGKVESSATKKSKQKLPLDDRDLAHLKMFHWKLTLTARFQKKQVSGGVLFHELPFLFP